VSRHPAKDESGRPIVAERGRAETPDEAAERVAQARDRRRSRQTTFNLVLALLASLGIVALIVLVVVRPQTVDREPVDYRAIAADAQTRVDAPLAAPVLPEGWTANRAGLSTGDDGILTWQIGFVTPGEQYIGLVQGIDADDRWVGDQVAHAETTGSTVIEGTTWHIYDRRAVEDPGNYAYIMVADLAGSAVVLNGTASDAEFGELAAAVSGELERTA
jgi:hypothetical protein